MPWCPMQQCHAYGLPCRATKSYNETRDESIRYKQSYGGKDKTALSGTFGSTIQTDPSTTITTYHGQAKETCS